MRVLFFGTYDAEAHPRVAVLRDGLAATRSDDIDTGSDYPFTVDECNVPLRLSTAARVSMLRRPWLLPRLAVRLLTRWTRLARDGRRSARRQRPDVVVVGYLGHFDVLLARRLFPRSFVVLDHLIGASDTAADRGVSGGLRQRLLRGLDAAALRSADVVVVDTEEHRGCLPAAHRERAVVVPVGAPGGWFAPRPHDAVAASALRVVFFGLYTPLQGTPVIGAALAQLTEDPPELPPIEVTMIGSGQDFEQARRLADGNHRVTWRHWVPTDELPAVVAAHDVCLGIFGTGPKALRVVPNKVFQGAAAGTAIVTSDTPPQRRALGDTAIFVPPGDADALADALRALRNDRAALTRARSRVHRLALEQFAPDRVVAPLLARLRSTVQPTSR
jgi:glycosyltransferase involved in cell wall biosynthesis